MVERVYGSVMMKEGIDYIGVGCGAFIINDKNQVLLIKRTDKCKNEAGKWNIPGGSIDYNEEVEKAVIREIKEELGVGIENEKFMFYIDHIIPDEGQHWVSFIFKSRIKEGELKIMEPHKHSELRWFDMDNLPEEQAISFQLVMEKYKNA